MKILKFATALAMSMLATTTLAADPAPGTLSARTGTVVTPRNFPKHTVDDLNDMFRVNAQLGSLAVIRVDWNDGNRFEAARALSAMATTHGLTPVIELSPFKADELKGAALDPGKALPNLGGPRSFANPALADAFSQSVVELAQLQPAFLAVATDVNLLAQSDPAGFAAFATLYHAIYTKIKRVSPETKVFVTFQWDAMQAQSAAANRDLLAAFGSDLELLALRSEPNKLFGRPGPSGVPADYYARLSQYQSTRRPLFLEVSWPSDGADGEAEQARFVRSLPALLGSVQPAMLAWTFLHDVKILIFTVRNGLISPDGKEKPAFAAFKDISTDHAPALAQSAAPAAIAPRAARSEASKTPALFGIYTARLDGSDVQTIMTSADRELTHPRVSPDGSRIVLTRYNNRGADGKATEAQGYENTEIMILNLDGSGLETVIAPKPGVIASNGCWTPDGKGLIYISTDTPDRRPEIRLVDLETRRISRMPTPPGLSVSDPHWVGDELVFPVKGERSDALWTMKADGSRAHQVTHPANARKPGSAEPYGDFDPKLSPDGSRVAFMRIYSGSAWQVMVLDLNTGTERDLTTGGVIEGLPTWSSDGKRLLYRHIDLKKPEETGLYTMTPEGSDRKMVPLPRGFLYNHASFYPGDASSQGDRLIYTGTQLRGK